MCGAGWCWWSAFAVRGRGGVGGGVGGGGCIFHQTIYSGTQPDPRQSKFGVKVLYTGDIMIVLKIWDNIKHQYQTYNIV